MLPAPANLKFPQEIYSFDPEIGHWLESGQHAYTHDKEVVTNSHGLRDIEYTNEPSVGMVSRIIAGDSRLSAMVWKARIHGQNNLKKR